MSLFKKKEIGGYERIKDEDEEATSEEDWVSVQQEPAKIRDLIGFFICGLLNNFGYVVMLSAALDLVAKQKDLPPAIVLLADSLPGFLIQLAAPFFIHRFPYSVRVIFCVASAVASFIIPALCEPVWLKLLGVVFAAISSSLGEITFLAYSAYFNKNTVSAMSSGTGGAGILGSLSYLGITYFLSSKTTLLVLSPLPLLMGISFFFIISKADPTNIVKEEIKDEAPISEISAPLTSQERLRLVVKLLPYTIPLFLVYFGEYLINQGIAPVLVYPKSVIHKPGKEREYLFYQSIYQVGVFISRSSVNFVPIRNLWAPAVFQIINAIFLSFVAVFNFIPSIWIVFVIILWEGLLGGSIYVNTFYKISQDFRGREKEFCLSATSMSYGLSITLSALAGIGLKPELQNWRTKWANRKH